MLVERKRSLISFGSANLDLPKCPRSDASIVLMRLDFFKYYLITVKKVYRIQAIPCNLMSK
ncbi:hypothetical protein GCM10020331_012490 [Ectobacillus funiculus]